MDANARIGDSLVDAHLPPDERPRPAPGTSETAVPPSTSRPSSAAPSAGATWTSSSSPRQPPPPPPPPAAARARARWPLVLGLVLGLIVGVAGGSIGWQQRTVAAEWRDRAMAMERSRDDARGRTEALQRQLDELSEVLAVSEADVMQLEERIRELADEKAQAEDTATTVQVERDVFVQLSTTVAGAVDALDGCVTQLFSLLDDSVNAFNDAAAGRPVDVVPLNAAKDATTAFCNEARSAAAGAGAAADQLLR